MVFLQFPKCGIHCNKPLEQVKKRRKNISRESKNRIYVERKCFERFFYKSNEIESAKIVLCFLELVSFYTFM